MSAQAAGRAVNAASKASAKHVNEHVLKKGAKRDPELYVSIDNFYNCMHYQNPPAASSEKLRSQLMFHWHQLMLRSFSQSCLVLLVLQDSISVCKFASRHDLFITDHLPLIGRKPTSATSESKVTVAHDSMPWQQDSSSAREEFKYKYHPHGDPKNPPKEAPSALHSVIVPNVNLPKVSRLAYT